MDKVEKILEILYATLSTVWEVTRPLWWLWLGTGFVIYFIIDWFTYSIWPGMTLIEWIFTRPLVGINQYSELTITGGIMSFKPDSSQPLEIENFVFKDFSSGKECWADGFLSKGGQLSITDAQITILNAVTDDGQAQQVQLNNASINFNTGRLRFSRTNQGPGQTPDVGVTITVEKEITINKPALNSNGEVYEVNSISVDQIIPGSLPGSLSISSIAGFVTYDNSYTRYVTVDFLSKPNKAPVIISSSPRYSFVINQPSVKPFNLTCSMSGSNNSISITDGTPILTNLNVVGATRLVVDGDSASASSITCNGGIISVASQNILVNSPVTINGTQFSGVTLINPTINLSITSDIILNGNFTLNDVATSNNTLIGAGNISSTGTVYLDSASTGRVSVQSISCSQIKINNYTLKVGVRIDGPTTTLSGLTFVDGLPSGFIPKSVNVILPA